MFLNEFVNKTVSEMLKNRLHDESFNAIVTEAVLRTVEECAQICANHSYLGSEYANLLRNTFK
jgi:hypothetical protein